MNRAVVTEKRRSGQGEAGASGPIARRARGRSIVLWIVAVMFMLGSAAYQRLTGPTYPVEGRFTMGDSTYAYRLPRSDYSTRDARIAVPDPGAAGGGMLFYRRYPTDDDLAAVPLRREDDQLVGAIPAQPPAGKVEYFVQLETAHGELRLPSGRETVVLRFKGPVPAGVVIPHVACMFFAVLVGMRAGLGALIHPRGLRTLAWAAFALMTVGGMILGPIVQKHAFGEYWTGFPFGYDLTDNKVLLMWLVWFGACVVVGIRGGGTGARRSRWAVGLAALVMVVVYLIPHSAQGSELDYEALERGVPASEAVRTG